MSEQYHSPKPPELEATDIIKIGAPVFVLRETDNGPQPEAGWTVTSIDKEHGTVTTEKGDGKTRLVKTTAPDTLRLFEEFQHEMQSMHSQASKEADTSPSDNDNSGPRLIVQSRENETNLTAIETSPETSVAHQELQLTQNEFFQVEQLIKLGLAANGSEYPLSAQEFDSQVASRISKIKHNFSGDTRNMMTVIDAYAVGALTDRSLKMSSLDSLTEAIGGDDAKIVANVSEQLAMYQHETVINKSKKALANGDFVSQLIHSLEANETLNPKLKVILLALGAGSTLGNKEAAEFYASQLRSTVIKV